MFSYANISSTFSIELLRDKLEKFDSVVTSQQVQLKANEELLAHSKVRRAGAFPLSWHQSRKPFLGSGREGWA